MKVLLIAALIFSAQVFAEDCVKLEGENLCMELEWTDGPNFGSYSSNIVRFIDLDHSTVRSQH